MGSDQSWNSRIPSVHSPEMRLYTRRYDLTYPRVRAKRIGGFMAWRHKDKERESTDASKEMNRFHLPKGSMHVWRRACRAKQAFAVPVLRAACMELLRALTYLQAFWEGLEPEAALAVSTQSAGVGKCMRSLHRQQLTPWVSCTCLTQASRCAGTRQGACTVVVPDDLSRRRCGLALNAGNEDLRSTSWRQEVEGEGIADGRKRC